MERNEILEVFKKKGAILEGHFLLSSGLHSSQYVQCALILQHPSLAETLGDLLAEEVFSILSDDQKKIDLVISPALGGVIIGQESARPLQGRAIFCEREEGKMKLRRGFTIEKGEECLVVEDVITTGKSTREVMEVVKENGGTVSAVACLIDRSGGVNFGVPLASLLKLEIGTYQPEQCPLCKKGIAVVKPGSRKSI